MMQKQQLWKKIHSLSPMQKQECVRKIFFSEQLISLLEEARGKGRNDFPVQYMWEFLMTKYAFSSSMEEIRRRYLSSQRDQRLGHSCPSAAAFSRFFTTLIQHQGQIYTLLNHLLARIQNILPDFGRTIAVEQFPMSRKKSSSTRCSFLGSHFQYLLDTRYDIPIIGGVREQSTSLEHHVIELLEQMKKNCPILLNGCKYFLGREEYDREFLIAQIWDQYKIKPVIVLQGTNLHQSKSISTMKDVFYDEQGNVTCQCPVTMNRERMQCFGFEKKRESLRYKCMSGFYGLCNASHRDCIGGKGIRISLKKDRRLFTPLARSYYQWSKIYQSWDSRYSLGFFHQMLIERAYLRGKNVNLEYALSHCFLLALILSILEKEKATSIFLPSP